MAGTGYRTGGLHGGEAGTGANTGMQPQVGAGTGGHTGMLHPGGVSNVNQTAAVPVNRGTVHHDSHDHDLHEESEEMTVAGGGRETKAGKAINGMARTVLAILQILTFLVRFGGVCTCVASHVWQHLSAGIAVNKFSSPGRVGLGMALDPSTLCAMF